MKCVGSTRWELLFEIASEHPSVFCRNGLSTEQLREHLAAPDEPFVVIIDEVGGLEAPAVIQGLAGSEWVSLICIGHDRAHAFEQVPGCADTALRRRRRVRPLLRRRPVRDSRRPAAWSWVSAACSTASPSSPLDHY